MLERLTGDVSARQTISASVSGYIHRQGYQEGLFLPGRLQCFLPHGVCKGLPREVARGVS